MQWVVCVYLVLSGVQPVFGQEIDFKLEPRPMLVRSFTNHPGAAATTSALSFNDPFFHKQNFLRMIEAEAAYAVLLTAATPTQKARIGIIDQGRIAADHIELQGRILPGSDTENGKVDHGQFVLGIMAAQANNESGIVGVAGGDADFYYRSLPLQKRKPDANRIAALIREMGALRLDAINLSFAVEKTCSSRPPEGDECYHAIVAHSGIRQAIIDVSSRYNTLFFVSAGNSSQKIPQYSLPSQGVIVVGSSTKDRKIAGHSNHGPGVDIYLPEVGIYGLTAKGIGSPQVGTSFTTPVATAAAGLTYRYLKNKGVSLTPGQFMALVLASSHTEPNLLRDTSSGRLFNFRKLAEGAQNLVSTGR